MISLQKIELNKMKKYISITLLFLLAILVKAQPHSIDQYVMNFSDNYNVITFSENTYYNTYESVELNWEIIESSMPVQWDFSNCFPDCNKIGVTSGSNTFPANTEHFLGCHFYPNNTPGTGIVKMKISTNHQYVDTVTWVGVASSSNSLNDDLNNIFINLDYDLYDIWGKRIKTPNKNSIYIVAYSDGRIEKKIIIE